MSTTPKTTILPQVLKQTTPKNDPTPKPTFTGSVDIDMLHNHPDPNDRAVMAMVTFTPSARTHWHWHERGQTLTVFKGQGWVCDKGGKARRIREGDVLFCPPGTTHWHGADEGCEMMHLAVGLGETRWLEGVSEEEYRARE